METLHAFEETLRVLREGARLCVPGAIEGKVRLDYTSEGWTVRVTALTRDAEGTYTHVLYRPSVVLPDLSDVLRNATASITAGLAGIRREAEDRLRDVERSITELMGDDQDGALGWTGVPETCGARLRTRDDSVYVAVRCGRSGNVEIQAPSGLVLNSDEARALSALLRQCGKPHKGEDAP
jgi:hypothetical protein